MPRPQTKTELIAASACAFVKLEAMLDTLTPEQATAEFAFEDRDRCVRDILIHLHEWHHLVLVWAKAGLAGRSESFFPSGYNWKNYPELNKRFTADHANTTLEEARDLLDDSHGQIMTLVDGLTNQELFTKKHYDWTGTTSLGAYLVSSTSSHYEWAMKKIRRHLKTQAASH